MDNKAEKLNGKAFDSSRNEKSEMSNVQEANPEVESISTGDVAQQLVEHVSGIETASEDEGTFGEDEDSYKGRSSSAVPHPAKQSTAKTQISAQPPIAEMIKQTVEAIENELRKTEDEMKTLLKRHNVSPALLNDKVKEIRFLNGILSELKRAAQLAEDFIVSLWKRYVKKS